MMEPEPCDRCGEFVCPDLDPETEWMLVTDAGETLMVVRPDGLCIECRRQRDVVRW
jgi:hypothetical protein